MERMHNEELSDVARLVEVTSDAVAICDADGTVAHVNRQMLSLGKIGREQVVGADIKDLLYSVSFERSMGHKVPFTADGSENTLMLKLADGSFIPVRVRAIELSGSPEGEGDMRIAMSWPSGASRSSTPTTARRSACCLSSRRRTSAFQARCP